jgi:hypothetical protein
MIEVVKNALPKITAGIEALYELPKGGLLTGLVTTGQPH